MDATKDTTSLCATTDACTTDTPINDALVATQYTNTATSEVIIYIFNVIFNIIIYIILYNYLIFL